MSMGNAFQDDDSDSDEIELGTSGSAQPATQATDAQLRASAVSHAEAGEFGKAITSFKQYLKFNSTDGAAWEMLAQLQMETEQLFDAVKVRWLPALETRTKR